MRRLLSHLSYANVMSSVAVFFVLGGGAYAAISSIPGPDGVIHGCYQKNKGTLRVVPSKKKCLKSELALQWNQQGKPGVPGLVGAAGPGGAAGQNGSNGANGASGTNGAPGTARAYAHVLPGPSPTFDAARTHGFSAVSHGGATGVYCLTPDAGISPASYPAVAVGEWGDSGGSMPYLTQVDDGASSCPVGDYEIQTLQGSSPALSDTVSFDVIVP